MLPVLQREWQRFCPTPRLWWLAILAPLGLLAVLSWTFTSRVPQGMPLVVVDYDQTVSSRALIRSVNSTSSIQVLQVRNEEIEGVDALKSSQAYALMVIPRRYEQDLHRGVQPTVHVYYNEQMLTAGDLIMRDALTTLATVNAGIAISQGLSVPMKIQSHNAFNPGMDYWRFLAAPLGLAILNISMVIVGIDVIGREIREGTAGQWMAVARGRVGRALLGKLFIYAVWYSLLGVIGVPLWIMAFDIQFAGSVLLWGSAWTLMVIASLCLSVTLISAFGNFRMATSIASLVVSPAFAFGGVTFPSLSMPLGGQVWSFFLPLTQGAQSYIQQVLMDSPVFIFWPHLWVLLFFMLLPFLLLNRLRHILVTPSCWGEE